MVRSCPALDPLIEFSLLVYLLLGGPIQRPLSATGGKNVIKKKKKKAKEGLS